MNFGGQVTAFAKRANISIDRTMRGVSIKLFSAVIKSWPVKTGRSRANWMASGSTPAVGFSEVTDKIGSATISQAASYISNAVSSSEFTLSNNAPWAHPIEYGGYLPGNGPNTVGGFSKQAPQGAVRINASRFQRLLDEAARENR